MDATFTVIGTRSVGPPLGLAQRLAYLVAVFQQLLVDKGYTIGSSIATVDRVQNQINFKLQSSVSIQQEPADPTKFPEYIAHEFRVMLYNNNYDVSSLTVMNKG